LIVGIDRTLILPLVMIDADLVKLMFMIETDLEQWISV